MLFNYLKARATSRWQMAFKQRQYTTTKNMLKQLIYHVYSFNTFSLSEEIKDKCIAIIQKQIITKIIIRWQESYKTSTWIWKDSRRMVLVSCSVIQTSRLLSDFTVCLVRMKKMVSPFLTTPPFLWYNCFSWKWSFFGNKISHQPEGLSYLI